MQITTQILNLIPPIIIFLPTIIPLITSIPLIKFHDLFLPTHAPTKTSTLSLLLTLLPLIIFFISSQRYLTL
ncbi:monovalent cation/H(+) antiporter subunit G, partial [Staphylococcus saprophyticus]|uniref:monovalent cation/H(+) antiporter subunit G n=1 Tax=Staphylococcus saprophyticus TaxID=29385 RepID=UPI001642FEE1